MLRLVLFEIESRDYTAEEYSGSSPVTPKKFSDSSQLEDDGSVSSPTTKVVETVTRAVKEKEETDTNDRNKTPNVLPALFSKMPSPYLDSIFTFRPSSTLPSTPQTPLSAKSAASPLLRTPGSQHASEMNQNVGVQRASVGNLSSAFEEDKKPIGTDGQQRIFAVSNLPLDTSTDMVFNLFCIFGNVNKV